MQYTSWLKAYKVVVQCMSHKATAHVWSPSWHVRGKKKEAVSQKNCRDHAGMRLRGVLIHEVFRKVLYLTPSERAKFSSGRIYSHVTSDVETIQQLSWSGLGIISSPLRIIGASSTVVRLCLHRPW